MIRPSILLRVLLPLLALPLAFGVAQPSASLASAQSVAVLAVCVAQNDSAPCPDAPQLWTVSRPYGIAGDAFTIYGSGLGDTPGSATLGECALHIDAWSNSAIEVTIPAPFRPDAYQLLVTRSDGQAISTGLTFHLLEEHSAPGRRPALLTVRQDGSGDYRTIQAAIDAAPLWAETLIVIYPGLYTENLVLYKPVRLQGVGPGGPLGKGGVILDGGYPVLPNNLSVSSSHAMDRRAAITVAGMGNARGPYPPLRVDGLTITGAGAGAIQVAASVGELVISNNVIQANSGNWGGAVTIGMPYSTSSASQSGGGVRIHHNRILDNEGGRLAGAIAIFGGAAGYEIDHNILDSNRSVGYGGGISHLGYSPSGRIHHNTILYNEALGDGGGILISGEPGRVSAWQGSGPVDIYSNRIQGNASQAAGGGIRLLRTGAARIRVANNIIANNVAAKLGGGVALADTYDAILVNNTIAWNASTSTAADSDGKPHAAGLAAEPYSASFQALLGPDEARCPDPVLFNTLFSQNIAYIWNHERLEPIDQRDLGVEGAEERLHPNYCMLTLPYPPEPADPAGSHNLTGNPHFVAEHETELHVVTLERAGDTPAIVVTVERPPGMCGPPGNYRLEADSRASGAGLPCFAGACAPVIDADGAPRPSSGAYTIGAYER